jgi:hypothetical protein
MTISVQNIIRSFEQLPEIEKREVAREIIRRTLEFDIPPMSDEELVLTADELFLELDRREAEDGKSRSR